MSDFQVQATDQESIQRKKNREINEQAQAKAEEYADGLHGVEYYKTSGAGVTELDAVLKRYRAIPMEKWHTRKGMTQEEDRERTFQTLTDNAPPEYSHYVVTAADKKAMGMREKKDLDDQLKKYEEDRKNWESSAAGKTWENEVTRLRDMEKNPYTKFRGADVDVELAGRVRLDRDIGGIAYKRAEERPEAAGLSDELFEEFTSDLYVKGGFNDQLTDGDKLRIRGLDPNRIVPEMTRSLGEGMSNEQIKNLFRKLMAPKLKANMTDEKKKEKAKEDFAEGVKELKAIYFRQIKRLEASYGTLVSDMHPDDFLRWAPEDVEDHFHPIQDFTQFMDDAKDFFDFSTEEDQEYKRLSEYYHKAWQIQMGYMNIDYSAKLSEETGSSKENVDASVASMISGIRQSELDNIERLRSGVKGGPTMGYFQKKRYMRDLRERFKDKNAFLFGKFA